MNENKSEPLHVMEIQHGLPDLIEIFLIKYKHIILFTQSVRKKVFRKVLPLGLPKLKLMVLYRA